MPVTGEVIRMMNYVDDIATALRRIKAQIPSMSAEERKQLAEYLKKSSPHTGEVIAALDAGVGA